MCRGSSRLLGLADVVVYVASDERYNDEVPTQFLQLLIRAGRAVVIVLTKMAAAQAPRLVEHFQSEVLDRLIPSEADRSGVPILTVPFLTADYLADPVRKAAAYRIPLVNQVMVLGDPAVARKRSVKYAVQYLSTSGGELLDVARQDLAAIDAWRSLVQSSRMEFDTRYRNEFLAGEGFRRFDEARERLLNLLELPGAGRFFAMVMLGLRFPYRALRSAIEKAAHSSAGRERSAKCKCWIERFALGWTNCGPRRSAGQKRIRLWKHVSGGFNSGLTEAAAERFQSLLRSFQVSSADEIEVAARAVTAGLEKNPAALVVLRAGKLMLDVVAIVLAIWAGGWNWLTLILIPIFVSIAHQLVELVVRQYVEGKRSAIRSRKMTIVSQSVSGPLAEWLTKWPATGGSAYEKLQAALRRVPASIAQLERVAEQHLRS